MFPTADTEDISQVTSLTTNSGPASDAHNSAENIQVSTQHNRELTLNMLFKEIIFCIALALTTYGALHNTPTKISKHPTATRFFKPDSSVKDWYRGQLSHALHKINNEDVSFVMYYAPWDAESQYVRDEFERAAGILKDRVHFAAINCWNPGSECQLQNSKIPSWPILMVYTVISRGVLYKGLRDAHSMVNFLELMMKPMTRVSSSEDLVTLLSYCDAVAVGYTPLTETSKHYNVWYTVALRVREADTIGEICFAVVTSEDLALELGVDVLPNARLMLWNNTKEYISRPTDAQVWNDSSLIHWVLENFSQPVARIIPLWRKAFNFERYVDGNPILMLFTPLNPLYEQLPAYSLLREVAMEYYNCHNNDSSQWTTELTRLQHVQRILYHQKNFTKFCQEYKFKTPVIKLSRVFKREVESRNNKYPWTNTTERTQKSGVFNVLLKHGLGISKDSESADEHSQLLSSLDWLQECSTKALPAERSFYEQFEQCHSYEENLAYSADSEILQDEIETTMLPLEDDPLSPENLLQNSVRHFCKLMKFAHEFGPPIYPPIQRRPFKQNVTVQGLACAHNFSLHILAVDSVRNHHFAESLGIDVRNKKNMTAVVILDSKHESQYVLSEEFNDHNIRQFIYNFTHKNLKRSLRTHVGAAHTHYFGSDGRAPQMGLNENSTHIVDLTTRSFRRMVKTPDVLTIVCVCGGACGSLVVRALLEAKRLLGACGVPMRAARLDALRHDLPWHFSPPHYPTLLAFPAHRRGSAESASYPAGARLGGAGVLALALRSLPTHQRLRLRLALCHVQSIAEKRTCLKDLRAHVTSLIGRNLKYWRQTQHTELRDALLNRLLNLQKVSFDLSLFHSSDLSANSAKQTSLLNTFSVLSQNWDIDVSSLINTTKLRTRS